jgi:hypothetical protein
VLLITKSFADAVVAAFVQALESLSISSHVVAAIRPVDLGFMITVLVCNISVARVEVLVEILKSLDKS